MARFENDPNRLNYTLEQQGKEYQLRLLQRAQATFSNLLNLLPSNYISTVQGPNYTNELKAVAVEIAKLELAIEDVDRDGGFANTRSDFLYSIIGYLVFLNGQLPVTQFDDVEFKRFLLSVIKIYFQGSIPASIQEGVALFISEDITVYENFLLLRSGVSGLDISDQFGFQIDIAGGFPSNLFALDSNIRLILDIIRPAHTLFKVRYLFKDPYVPNGDQTNEVLDSYRWRMSNYYYDDFRVYPDGVRNRDRLGVKTNKAILLEGHSHEYSDTVYTNRGPIAKPPFVLQSGTSGSFGTIAKPLDAVLNLPGGSFIPSIVGLFIVIGNSAINSGSYRITSVLSSTKVRVDASFRSDPNNGSLTWQVLDYRNGQIANSPVDVTVLVNSVPVTPLSVTGLLGKIVLPSTPAPTDVVVVSYYHIENPTVEFRKLNSTEFVLNNWNRNAGNTAQHCYRYNATLPRPSDFSFSDIQASLDQPQTRGLYYRAYERAYTAGLNDPNLLVLNVPTHRIAYPPLSRTIDSVSVQYNALELPEQNSFSPWERKGQGLASVALGKLTVQDNSTGPFPTGNPIFWTRGIDVTFPHVFAAAWRVAITATPTKEGVFTGVAAGWSTDEKAIVVGYLFDGGVAKIGFIKKGAGDATYDINSWTGGVDVTLTSTGLPATFDWSIEHSFRLFRDRNGIIKLFIDGEIVETLRITEDELPYLEELNDPFNRLEGAFFGAISRPAISTSVWSFFRYLVLPTNPEQVAPAVFVQYEANTVPESSVNPWTPVGYHGTETIIGGDFLLLDSTSATSVSTSSTVGLIGGDFRGFDRLEPLLSVSSDVVLDTSMQVLTYTHGISPNAVMVGVDDGNRLVQLSFIAAKSSPKFSYPGRSLPEDATPLAWSSAGTTPVAMLGRTLRITDSSATDGRVYYMADLEPDASPNRIFGGTSGFSYVMEFRVKVISHTPDVSGFSGVTVETSEGTPGRLVGLMLRDNAGVKTLAFHSDGSLLGLGTEFAFNWDDGQFHTYRVIKNGAGSLVTVLADGVYLGSVNYTTFTSLATPPIFSWGSSTTASMAAVSVVDWAYANAWRIADSAVPKFVGFWKGYDPDALTGYHLPTKVVSSGTLTSAGDTLSDPSVNFISLGVVANDYLIIDEGLNKGSYPIQSVFANAVEIASPFPQSLTTVNYRIAKTVDWTTLHQYRLVRDPGGSVSLILDNDTVAILRVEYSEKYLPASALGIPQVLAGGLPSITFGAFDPTNLSQTKWDYVRYGIKRASTDTLIVPHHRVLNQRNVMSSPEHLTTSLPHSHTDYWSSSTGIPPKTDPDFLADSGLNAFTQLNEGTPLVPSTQTFEVRHITPVVEFLSGFNNPSDVLNNNGSFLMNDGATDTRLDVPNDVLYNSLDVLERQSGVTDMIAPLSDNFGLIDLGTISYQKEVCLKYDGSVLPELDMTAGTPWVLDSTTPSDVSTVSFAGVLTYSVGAIGDNTIYRNATLLPDSISLGTEVTFRLRVLNDASGGTGDTNIRFGFSALGLTLAVALRTSILGERTVDLLDFNSQELLGSVPFDFLDGNYHTYKFNKDPSFGLIHFSIDS